MLATKAAPSLLLMLGSVDWLTTVIGIAFFGAVESNPFISTLTNTNLPAFTALKLGTASIVAFLFYQVERTLEGTTGDIKRNRCKVYFLRGLQAAAVFVLLAASVNNISIILSSIA